MPVLFRLFCFRSFMELFEKYRTIILFLNFISIIATFSNYKYQVGTYNTYWPRRRSSRVAWPRDV